MHALIPQQSGMMLITRHQENYMFKRDPPVKSYAVFTIEERIKLARFVILLMTVDKRLQKKQKSRKTGKTKIRLPTEGLVAKRPCFS